MALDIVRVDSVRAAAAVLAAEEGARFLGGGTLLVRAINSGFIAPTRLVLSDGLGLDRIDIRGGEVELGAAVTMAEIAAHPQLSFLRPVAVSIGGPAVRAMATVGGNLFARYPYGDFAVALLALDAEISSEDLDGTAVVPLGDFLAMPAGNRRRIVRSIRFQLPADGAFRYAKIVRKKPHGASVISIAANLPVDGGKLGDVRVAYGAMAPRPIRATRGREGSFRAQARRRGDRSGGRGRGRGLRPGERSAGERLVPPDRSAGSSETSAVELKRLRWREFPSSSR